MNFQKLGKYRHKYSLDIDVIILNIQRWTEDYVECKVAYVLQNYTQGLLGVEVVKIKKEQYNNWNFIPQ